MKHGKNRARPLANIVWTDRDTLRPDLVNFHVIFDSLRDSRLEAGFVSPSGVSPNSVDVTPHPRIRRLRPAQSNLVSVAAFDIFLRRELLFVNRFPILVLQNLVQVSSDAIRVGILVRLLLNFVDEGDLQAAVDELDVFEVLTDDVGLEVDRSKNLLIRSKENRRPMTSKRLDLFDGSLGHPSAVRLEKFVAITMDGCRHLDRKRIHDRRANSVQATGACVILVRKFAACVEHRQDDFKRRLLVFLVLVYRDAATVVADRALAPVFMQSHFDVGTVSGKVLVDRVVDDFPQKMMKSLAVDASDVHGRPHPDGFQPFQNIDVISTV